MTSITTAPPTIVQGPEHPGSKKMPAKADPTLNLTETSVDKTIFSEGTQGSPMKNPDLPSSHIRHNSNGQALLVRLNQTGVVTREMMPSGGNPQIGTEKPATPIQKNPYTKTG